MGLERLDFEIEREPIAGTRIRVIGVGGAGGNIVDDMIQMGLNSVEFYTINTDVKALLNSGCSNKVQIGQELTQGNGAGSDPEIGQQAAMEAEAIIKDLLFGSHLVFITAGLGKGTGTGAVPVIARLAKELDIVTIAIVSRPFHFEGHHRLNIAEKGLEKLRQICDAVVVISNERLLQVVGKRATFFEALKAANKILAQGVESIAELITGTGLINVDFADIKSILSIPGNAMIGIGYGKGENRAIEAVKRAYSTRLVDRMLIDGAKGALIYITGGPDLELQEVYDAANMVVEAADPEAKVIFGAAPNKNLKDEIKIIIIVTGLSTRQTNQTINRDYHHQLSAGIPQPAMAGSIAGGQQHSPQTFSHGQTSQAALSSNKFHEAAKDENYNSELTGGEPHPAGQAGYEDKELSSTKPLASQDTEEEYYDIPAFIRRRKNKAGDKQLKLF